MPLQISNFLPQCNAYIRERPNAVFIGILCFRVCSFSLFSVYHLAPTLRSGADTGGDESPYQTERDVDMTLDFIENHRQQYFCTAHYVIAKYAKN